MTLSSRFIRSSLIAATMLGLLGGCATSTKSSVAGTNRSQFLLVSAEQVNTASLQFYAEQNTEARKKGALITSGAEYNRVHAIMQRIVPLVGVFREDATSWKWELVLIDDQTVNAHVMAGGKITFYTGLIRRMQLTDDEIAAVMGHEIAHALREHTREKVSQDQAATLAVNIGGALLGAGQTAMQIAGLTKTLGLDLPFSRHMESEADEFGLELAARAGYNPKASITLWEKMGKQGGSVPKFLSTHPPSEDRIKKLTVLQPKVQPLYEATIGKK